jgi:hypothetical protein
MRRTVGRELLVVLAALGFASVAMAQEMQTLKGEIVDPASYQKEGRRGLEMEDATFEAVDGGQTLALLEDGTENLYLFLGAEAGEDPNELAYDYVNQAVTVTGDVYERGGLRGIVAESVDPLAAPVAAPDTATLAPATPPLEPDNLD